MSIERKRKARNRFAKWDEAAIRAWLGPAEHNLRVLRDRVAAAHYVLDKRLRPPTQKEQGHG